MIVPQTLRTKIFDAAQRMANASGDLASSKYRSEKYYRAKDAYKQSVTDLLLLLENVK